MSDQSNSPKNNIKQDDFNNLFLEVSEDGPSEENLNHLFTSSESSETKNANNKNNTTNIANTTNTANITNIANKQIKKSNSIDTNLSNVKQEVLNATTGMSIMGNQITNQIEQDDNNLQEDNDLPEFIDNADNNEIYK